MCEEYTLQLLILEYLQTHQQAGDTLEGIAKWWLTAKRVEDSVFQVKRSLDRLKSTGAVREKQLPDGKLLYVPSECIRATPTSEPATVITFPTIHRSPLRSEPLLPAVSE